jgi:hypothetical protein
MGQPSRHRFPWQRIALVILPWVIASVGVAVTIDGVAFRRGDENLLLPPPGSPAAPVERAPTPKSEERVIDPSERVNV